MTAVGERVEQVRSLQEGDTVRFRHVNWPEDRAVTGKVYLSNQTGRSEPRAAGHPLLTMAACGTLAEFEILARAADGAKAEAEADPIRSALSEVKEGDVVRFRRRSWPKGSANTGPVYVSRNGGELTVGGWYVHPKLSATYAEFEIVERAPLPGKPVYVNSKRTEPVPGDIVRDADRDDRRQVWMFFPAGTSSTVNWVKLGTDRRLPIYMLPPRLRLVVDGKTGKAVPE
jgi:hypothetical protein